MNLADIIHRKTMEIEALGLCPWTYRTVEEIQMLDKAEQIVDKIIENLSDRRGLGQEWDQIDEEIQTEIREEWVGIAQNVLEQGKE